MKITNTKGMPEVYERLIRQDREYVRPKPEDKKSYSVTTLCDSAFKYKLGIQHETEVIEDVIDLFPAFRGSMMHKALEGSSLKNLIPELPLRVEIDGVWVSGRPDAILPGEIDDYKMKTMAALFYHDDNDVYELAKQLNIYRYLIYKIYRMPIEKLTGHIFMMDWVARKARFDSTYPQKPHFAVDVPVWSLEETERFLRERIAVFELPFEETPICSPAERWTRPTTWAVIHTQKPGGRALKVEDTEEAATAWLQGKIALQGASNEKKRHEWDDVAVVKRPGEDTRCMAYCRQNIFCPYWIETYGNVKAASPEADIASDTLL